MPKSNKSKKNRSFKNKNNSLKKRNRNIKTKNKTKTKKRLRGGSGPEGSAFSQFVNNPETFSKKKPEIKNKNKTSRNFIAKLKPLGRGSLLSPLVHPTEPKWIYSNGKWIQEPRLLEGEKTQEGQLTSVEQYVQSSPSKIRRFFSLGPKYKLKTLSEKKGSSELLNKIRELPLYSGTGTNQEKVMNNKLHDILASKAMILTMERGKPPTEFQIQALKHLNKYFKTPEEVDNYLRVQGQKLNIHHSLLKQPLFPKRFYNPKDWRSGTFWRQFDKMTNPSTPTPKSSNQNNILHLNNYPGFSSSSSNHPLGNTKHGINSRTTKLNLNSGHPGPKAPKSLRRSKGKINLSKGLNNLSAI